MKRYAIGALALLASGCSYFADKDAELIKVASDKVASMLIDPSSAQFRNVFVKSGLVCGEINGKNRLGAYTGFKSFYYVRNDLVPPDFPQFAYQIDPQFEEDDLRQADELCRNMSEIRNFSPSSARGACKQRQEEIDKMSRQKDFDAFYDVFCSQSTG